MSQSLSMNFVHLICSSINRNTALEPAIRSKLYAYQVGILQQWNSPAIVTSGVADHIHALYVLSKNVALSKVVRDVEIVCCALSGLLFYSAPAPRALPWAAMSLPPWGEQ